MYSSTTFIASCEVKRPCINVRVSLRLCKPNEIASVRFAMKLSGLIRGPWRRSIKTGQHWEGRLTRRISKVFWTLRSSHRHQSCECISLFPRVTLRSFCALLSYWVFLLCQRWKQRRNISFTWMIHRFLLYLATLLQTFQFKKKKKKQFVDQSTFIRSDWSTLTLHGSSSILLSCQCTLYLFLSLFLSSKSSYFPVCKVLRHMYQNLMLHIADGEHDVQPDCRFLWFL